MPAGKVGGSSWLAPTERESSHPIGGCEGARAYSWDEPAGDGNALLLMEVTDPDFIALIQHGYVRDKGGTGPGSGALAMPPDPGNRNTWLTALKGTLVGRAWLSLMPMSWSGCRIPGWPSH